VHRTPPITFDPAATQAWLLGPSDEFDDLNRAESLGVDEATGATRGEYAGLRHK
jgi:hypothetical protein